MKPLRYKNKQHQEPYRKAVIPLEDRKMGDVPGVQGVIVFGYE